MNIRRKKCENKVPMSIYADYENICNPMAQNWPPPHIEASRYEEIAISANIYPGTASANCHLNQKSAKYVQSDGYKLSTTNMV